MAVCQHKLIQPLDEWLAMMNSQGKCRQCGEIMDELVYLRYENEILKEELAQEQGGE